MLVHEKEKKNPPQNSSPLLFSPSFTYLCSLLNLHPSHRCWLVLGWTAPPPPWLNGRPSKIPRTQGNDPSWVVARHGVSSKPPAPPPPSFHHKRAFHRFFYHTSQKIVKCAPRAHHVSNFQSERCCVFFEIPSFNPRDKIFHESSPVFRYFSHKIEKGHFFTHFSA